MYKLQLKKYNSPCLDINEISNNNWQLVENYNGTVSLFDNVLDRKGRGSRRMLTPSNSLRRKSNSMSNSMIGDVGFGTQIRKSPYFDATVLLTR